MAVIHIKGGKLSSLTTTTCPGLMSTSSEEDHLCLCWSCDWYSFDQRLQKCCINCWVRCHRGKRLVGTSVTSGSGSDERAAPIRKWPGVKGEGSLGQVAKGVNGREFRQASIVVSVVYISSDLLCLLLALSDISLIWPQPPESSKMWWVGGNEMPVNFLLRCTVLNLLLMFLKPDEFKDIY